MESVWATGLFPVLACFVSTYLSDLRLSDLSLVRRGLTETPS